MGMYYSLYTVSYDQAQELLNDPETIYAFLEMRDADYDSPTYLSLEKSWHGVHFALTGTAWEGETPLNFLMTGEPIGDEDLVGYGPARIRFFEDVLQIDKSLSEFTEQDFDSNFDVRAMEEAEIYPQIWDEPREDLLVEYQSYFRALKRFVHDAAENKQSIVTALR
jgi:Domain of unknown function (DUF1877)